MLANPAICDSCRFRLSDSSCEAFDVIPDDILTEGQTHVEPRESQVNDVVWGFAPGTEEQFRDWKKFQEAGS